MGSSTATICVVNRDKIQIVNLGDSGALIVKVKNGMAYRVKGTIEQVHDFNTPYQLARFPKQRDFDLLEKMQKLDELQSLKRAMDSNSLCRDSVFDSDILNHSVSENEIVILGTDGGN